MGKIDSAQLAREFTKGNNMSARISRKVWHFAWRLCYASRDSTIIQTAVRTVIWFVFGIETP